MGTQTVRGRTLLVVLGAALVTAVLVGAAALVMLRGELENAAAEANVQRARRLAAHVRGAVAQGVRGLAEVAAAPAVRGLDPSRLGPALDLALRAQPIFHSIYVYDRQGQVVLRQYRTGTDQQADRSSNLAEKDDPEFRAAATVTLRDGQARSLPLRRNRGGDLFVPCLAAVPAAEGSAAGMLSGAVSAGGEGFDEMITGLAPGSTGWVALVDAKDQVLAASRRAPGAPGESLRPRPGDLHSRVPIEGLGLQAAVGLSRAEALASLPRAMVRLLLATLTALLAGGALGILLASRVTGPLGELVQGIRRVEEGVLGHRVQVEGEDEVAEVSRAFNRLAETLSRHEVIEDLWSGMEDVPGAHDDGERHD